MRRRLEWEVWESVKSFDVLTKMGDVEGERHEGQDGGGGVETLEQRVRGAVGVGIDKPISSELKV